MAKSRETLRVSLLAVPEASASTLSGIYDVFASVHLALGPPTPGRQPPFAVEIVGERVAPMTFSSGLPLPVQRAVDDVTQTDIVIVPSLVLADGVWRKGRYDPLVAWLAAMHRAGATICSACSGIFLIAETGLFDDRDATVHWGYTGIFRQTYPQVRVHPEKVLVSTGERQELLSSGASTSWHDLVLYIIAQHAGATAAQAITRFFAMQTHQDGLAPYLVFDAPRDHGDAVVTAAQDWLNTHHAVANPIAEMVKRSGLAERSFKRRFTAATGLAPIAYVQRLRVEEAKRRLERTRASVDEISWQVGYEDPAFFRRLFRRVTQLSPGDYRKRFAVPDAERGRG
jgi:transcriptional regulator GlxA family with amidase domain